MVFSFSDKDVAMNEDLEILVIVEKQKPLTVVETKSYKPIATYEDCESLFKEYHKDVFKEMCRVGDNSSKIIYDKDSKKIKITIRPANDKFLERAKEVFDLFELLMRDKGLIENSQK